MVMEASLGNLTLNFYQRKGGNTLVSAVVRHCHPIKGISLKTRMEVLSGDFDCLN